MPFLDFFRNFFSRGGVQEPPQNRNEDNYQHRDSFRNPIWQNDEDEDDVSDFRHPTNRYHFRIDSNPFEMTRFFETEMEHILRSLFSSDGFGSNFGDNSGPFLPFGDDEFTHAFGNPENKSKYKGPRDEVMKPEYGVPHSRFGFDDFTSIFSIPNKKPSDKGLCDDIMKPSYKMPDSNHQKVDSDLDGKIKSDEIAKILKNPSALELQEPQFSGKSFQFGKSVSTQIIRRNDGSIEERRTFKDSSGNEETCVTRQIGDKKHTVITKKAKDGSQEQTEDIINMDENELNGFNEKWSAYSKTPKQSITNFDHFPWHRFFGPNPKL